MKTLSWILAATGLGVVAYVLYNSPAPQHATGSSDVEGAARSTSQWGSKQRVRGAGGRFVGRAKEAVGNLTGSGELADKGVGEQVVGGLKDAAGQLAQAAGQTLHDLNR